jgi:hypothetical protein
MTLWGKGYHCGGFCRQARLLSDPGLEAEPRDADQAAEANMRDLSLADEFVAHVAADAENRSGFFHC